MYLSEENIQMVEGMMLLECYLRLRKSMEK